MHTRFGIAFLMTCASAVAAQETPVFRARPDTVVAPVTVTDRSGRPVYGLTADQFEIREGGTRRPIVEFSAGRVAVSLGILLDISGSVTEDPRIRADESARWPHMRRALELLLTRLDAADEVFFAVFNDSVAAVSWTQDHIGLLRGFDTIRFGGGNALLSAVPSILPSFELARYQRKVLVVITDGNDSHVPTSGVVPSDSANAIAPPGHEPLSIMGESSETVRQRRISTIKTAVRRSDVTLYAIGIGIRKGAPVNTVLLDTLTKESGGYVDSLRDPADLSAAVTRIWDDLRSQYLLSYEPGQKDGSYHGIRVTTKDRRLRVRARAGYVAPVSPSR